MCQDKEIILINKPKHWTSNDVVQKVKRLIKAKKVGHCGTLDPLATGLLILGINSGTKKMQELILNDKEYVAKIIFGYSTTTYDAEGEIVNRTDKIPSLLEIQTVLDSLKINYEQEVPIYSAVKQNGKKLYELARNNQTTELPVKNVTLFDYKINSYENNILDITLKVSKGFYIRSLANDLGKLTNSSATLIELTRTKIGDFSLDDALEIKDVYDYWIKF